MDIVKRIHKNPKVKLDKEFSHKDYSAKLPFDKYVVFRYISLMYTSNSEYLDIDYLPKRKAEAAVKAGFSLNGRFKKDIEAMLMGENKEVNKMIVRYCRQQRNTDYSLLMSYEELYYRLQNDMFNSKHDEGKSKDLIAAVDMLREKIKVLKLELTNYDDTKNLVDSLYNEMESDEVGLRPEDIARKLNLGIKI